MNELERGRVDPLVSRGVAIEDSRFVLEWLLQIHECESVKFRLPENIEGLSRRALKLFIAADEADYDAADPVSISDEEISELVKHATLGFRRLDQHGTPRSQSNAGEMQQKDHVLRIARGVESRGGSLGEFIELLSLYVDSEGDEILDEQPLCGKWMLGGA